MRLGDAALFVDQVPDAAGVFVFRRDGGAVGDADLPIGIAQQREGKFVFLRKLRIVFDVVETDAEDLRVFRFVLIDEVPEPGTFGGSAGGIGLRKKPEHDLLAAEVLQLPALAAMIGRFEIGCRIANLQHRRTSKD
jgi:hypothetical protein